jgi:hypothetical protein
MLKPLAQKTPSQGSIGRLTVELAIRIEQRDYQIQVGNRSLPNRNVSLILHGIPFRDDCGGIFMLKKTVVTGRASV